MKEYRYHLQDYKGPQTRLTCPACGKARTFVPYVDSRSGELLPEQYGRCNRESNCGHHLSPYQKGTAGLSYADQVYEQEKEAWKQDHPLPSFPAISYQQQVTKEQAPKPIHCIPANLCEQSQGHYKRNEFARLLRSHFGLGVAADLLAQFKIGTSSYWPGSCIFWLIDEQQRVRGGQVVLFDSNGHTAKQPLADGSFKRCTSWVHTALAHRYNQNQQPLPHWLIEYREKGDKAPCLFGLPQLKAVPFDRPIAIVEAPKTAVLCTPYFPEFIWMAVGALSYLNQDRMAPLRGRKVVLFPDLSTESKAFQLWNRKAIELRQQGFLVSVSDFLENRASQNQKEAGLDLADYLLEGWDGYPPSWDTPLTNSQSVSHSLLPTTIVQTSPL